MACSRTQTRSAFEELGAIFEILFIDNGVPGEALSFSTPIIKIWFKNPVGAAGSTSSYGTTFQQGGYPGCIVAGFAENRGRVCPELRCGAPGAGGRG